MNRFCCKVAQVTGPQDKDGKRSVLGLEGERSRSHNAEVRFGDLAEASFSISSVE